jgi:CRP-like cAMP-binding protein
MFIVAEGTCVACISSAQGDTEVEVKEYSKGQYFGEISLLQGVPRKASVYASSERAVCMMIDAPSFSRILGPVKGEGNSNAQYHDY